jgi:hypothetical protein
MCGNNCSALLHQDWSQTKIHVLIASPAHLNQETVVDERGDETVDSSSPPPIPDSRNPTMR